jgi:hypothetical protein
MTGPVSDAVDGYALLGKSLVERWNAHASAVAARLDAGTYDADHAVADLAKCVVLAYESGFLLASEALDAVAVLSARRGPVIRYSYPFQSPVAGAALSLAGPLTNILASDTLTIVTIDPAQLGPDDTKFRLRANATGRRAGLYTGAVQASGAAEPIPVHIVVP